MIHNESPVEWKVGIGCHSCSVALVASQKSHILFMNLTDHGLYLSYHQARNNAKMVHSGSNTEWKFEQVVLATLLLWLSMIIFFFFICIEL